MRKKIDSEIVFYAVVLAVIVAFFVVIIAFSANNEKNRITAGEVIDKRFYPAYTTQTENGMKYQPAVYWLEIEGMKDGETVQYSFRVPESEYTQYQIGDWYGKEE